MVAVETGTFADRFEVADSRWNASYGGAATSGGLGRVPCAHLGGVPQYAGLQSTSPGGSDTWTIASSYVYAKLVTVPAASGATSAWCQLAVLSATSGTYLSILYDATSGILSLTSRSGWSDPAAVYLAYNPTSHRWLRIRHTAGDLLWETSPDGLTWTTRRTLSPAPAWVTTDAVSVLIDCARDGGTTDYAEWDNLNITPVQPATPVAAVATIGTPGLSTGTTVTTGPVSATTTIGTPGLSTGTTVTPPVTTAVATIGTPGFAYIPLPVVCGTASVRGLTGTAATRAIIGTASVRGLTGTAAIKGGTACLP